VVKAAYVGILTTGSTSGMRADWLRRINPDWDWQWIDTDIPMLRSARIWQSLAFRYQAGLAVQRINQFVVDQLSAKSYDLIWVDKAVFLSPQTVALLRQSSRRLVHFTPDTAFGVNASRNFEQAIAHFDLLVTTKTFEIGDYAKRTSPEKVLLVSQGFDPRVHHPRATDDPRRKEVVFVGLAEHDRERCIAELLNNAITVRLAGRGWSAFVRKWTGHPNLIFAGEDAFGDAYAELLSNCWIGLGLLSKRFPELHTTRTFEIPACGAVLATEETAETSRFFTPREAIFFRDYRDLAIQVRELFSRGDDALARIATAGRARVLSDRRDYESLLTDIMCDQRIRL
jgi:spore maturation protein CgeB